MKDVLKKHITSVLCAFMITPFYDMAAVSFQIFEYAIFSNNMVYTEKDTPRCTKNIRSLYASHLEDMKEFI